MFSKIKSMLGLDPIKKQLDEYCRRIADINVLEKEFESLTDERLTGKTAEFRARFENGETLDELLPEAFAAVREASKRVLGLRHYDVQLIGGMTLHAGNIAEMRTGEGKTLVATLPIYLNAIAGKGVHLITVNDYLARRDARWMAPIYQMLGLSIGVLQMAARTDNGRKAFLVDTSVVSPREDQNNLRLVLRKEAYNADITYGTNSEFGFDYLRDNMTMSLEERVQRGHAYAIIDEVDNVLIDEARTPLIISGPASDNVEEYYRMAKIIKQLLPEEYEVSEKDHQVYMNDSGLDHVEELLGMVLRDPDRPEEITIEQERMMGYLEQALRAEFLYRRDKEYLVQSGKVIIVDSFTGRLMPGRRWSNGLHQAIEAKEGVRVEPENVTYATITLQNYYRMYQKIAGMTGTALTEKEEFYKIYLLDVIPIPTNLEYAARQKGSGLEEKTAKDEEGYKYTYYVETVRPDTPVYYKRKDYPDVIYQTEEAKFRAITVEILKNYLAGRPQLIGTASVEHSEFLASRLKAEPLRRLIQILMLRRAWMKKNKIDVLESPIKEFIPYNKPVQTISAAELRVMAKTLEMQLALEDSGNKEYLKEEFGLNDTGYEKLLKTAEAGISPQVLNARKHDEEGMIIAHAGAYGAITIATNMAGRGVDIKLGGELDENILRDANRVLSRAGIEPYNMTIEERYQALLPLSTEDQGIYVESVEAYKDHVEKMWLVRKLGGLHVIGSERHESRRIDNQLRGRAARQGDPGSSRFFLSLQDEIIRLFGGQQLESVLKRVNLIDVNVSLENNMFSRMIEQSQERVEGTNFDIRKHTLEYDDVLNSQRKRIYDQRDQAFTKEDLSEDILELLQTALKNRLDKAESEEKWKLVSYLDSVQPPIETEDMFLPSFSQAIILRNLRGMTPPAPEKDQLIATLLLFGRKAYEIEIRNGMEIMQSLIENTRSSYEAQLNERNANFDLFIESLMDKIKARNEARDEGEVVENLRPQDVLAEANSFARIVFKLSNEKQRQLSEGDEDVFDEMKVQIKAALFGAYIQRLNALISNRMGGDYAFSGDGLEIGDWEAFEERAMNGVENGYNTRSERLFGDQAQIQSALESTLANYQPSVLSDKQWIQALRAMSQGSRIAFDEKTHRKISKSYTRVNFIFYCGAELENIARGDVQEMVWNHLLDAIEGLRMIYGSADWQRIRANNFPLSRMKPELQDKIAGVVGEEVFAEIKDLEPVGISADIQEKIKPILGARIQNEINRQVLLRSITSQWVDYLTEIEALRVNISMESYAQRNPLVAYKTKAAELFIQLLNDIRQSVVERMFIAMPTVSMMTVSEITAADIKQTETGAAQSSDAPQPDSPQKGSVGDGGDAKQAKAAKNKKNKKKR